MASRPGRLSNVAVLAAGIVLGAILSGARTTSLRAGGGDHPDAPLALAATFATEINAQKVPVDNDAVFYLNYAKGYLLAAVPMPTQVGQQRKLLSDFSERDLIKDFQLAPGAAAHFTMASGKMGALSEGWAPLYVFESTTGQVAAYRVVPQARAGSSAPLLQLVEKRQDPRLASSRRTMTAQR